jgi:hypothetical protein
MATLVPRVDLYSGKTSDEYVLSIVMFYDRPADLSLTVSNENVIERTVSMSTLATGTTGDTGGEVLLYWPYSGTQSTASDATANERLKVRANDWVLLSGKQTVGSNSVDRFQWYRVTHCDPEVQYSAATTSPTLPARYERYVTLLGQDFDTTVLT